MNSYANFFLVIFLLSISNYNSLKLKQGGGYKQTVAKGVQIGEYVMACVQGIIGAMPPSFCEIYGSNPSIVCPSGTTMSSDSTQCIFNTCPSNYPNVYGNQCVQCPSGYVFSTQTYTPCTSGSGRLTKYSNGNSINNYFLITDSRAGCPQNYVKIIPPATTSTDESFTTHVSPWCKLNCTSIGPTYVDCGNNYCAASVKECNWGIGTAIVNMLVSVGEAVLDVISLGTTAEALSELKNTVMSAANSISKDVMNDSFLMLKTLIKNPNVQNKILSQAKASAKSLLNTAKSNIISSAIESTCNAVMSGIQNQISAASIVGTVVTDLFDFIGVANIANNCGVANYNQGSCTNAVLTSLSTFDPSGILGVIASFYTQSCPAPGSFY